MAAYQLQGNWDMVSLLLMVRINHEHRLAPGRERVPVLDEYLDRVHLMLWPRLKVRAHTLLGCCTCCGAGGASAVGGGSACLCWTSAQHKNHEWRQALI